MLRRLNRFDRLIAESEARIIEQVFLIMRIEARGGDSAEARRSLKAFELILLEYRRMKENAATSRRSMDSAEVDP